MKKTWFAVPYIELYRYLYNHKHILRLTDEQLKEVLEDVSHLVVEITEESEEEE